MSDGKFRSYRNLSRDADWGTSDGVTLDQINAGSMLRIADATEKMALRHTELIERCDRFERDAKYWRDRAETADRRCAALKGQITKLKRVAARWLFWRQHFKALTTMEVASKTGISLFWKLVTTPKQMDEVTDEAIKKGEANVGK